MYQILWLTWNNPWSIFNSTPKSVIERFIWEDKFWLRETMWKPQLLQEFWLNPIGFHIHLILCRCDESHDVAASRARMDLHDLPITDCRPSRSLSHTVYSLKVTSRFYQWTHFPFCGFFSCGVVTLSQIYIIRCCTFNRKGTFLNILAYILHRKKLSRLVYEMTSGPVISYSKFLLVMSLWSGLVLWCARLGLENEALCSPRSPL